MPFFTRFKQGKFSKKSQEKRKKPTKKLLVKKPKNEKANDTNEVISSDEYNFSDGEKRDENYSSEEETYQEKKLRLTKKYLEDIEQQEKEKAPDIVDTKQAVAQRLREIALKETGRLERKAAQQYENVVPEVAFVLKGHRLSVTCLVIFNNEEFLVTGSKDCSLIKWSLKDGRRLKVIPKIKQEVETLSSGHSAEILALAISNDDQFLATGGKDRLINVWNPDTMQLLKTFRGHKSAVTGLTFNKGSHQLISASSDRSLKLWNLDEMGFIETLFGHQDGITSIDCFQGETALTSGGRDNTLRIWKIADESQLVYQGHGSSIDCVCVANPQHFVSGGDDGSLSLWGLNKKKPLSKVLLVHGQEEVSGNPHWIVSLCTMPNTDLIASGSRDGRIRLWRRNDEKRALQPVSDISVTGFVNAMAFAPSGKFLISALGQEHKLGRWWKIKQAKNVVLVHKFPILSNT